MLKAWRTQQSLLSSPKVLIVKGDFLQFKNLTLMGMHWRGFGTLTLMLVEMAC